MISLVIPTLHIGDYLEKCINSFSGQYDEFIIADDPSKSLAQNINRGMRMAKGDFIIVSNDDVEANRGSLSDLCNVNKVLSPTVNGNVFKIFHAHLFCIPREIYAEIGGFDESCPGVYHIDSDYWIRLKKAGFAPEICEKVDVKHPEPGATTIKTLKESDRDIKTSRVWFIQKWGENALQEVRG